MLFPFPECAAAGSQVDQFGFGDCAFGGGDSELVKRELGVVCGGGFGGKRLAGFEVNDDVLSGVSALQAVDTPFDTDGYGAGINCGQIVGADTVVGQICGGEDMIHSHFQPVEGERGTFGGVPGGVVGERFFGASFLLLGEPDGINPESWPGFLEGCAKVRFRYSTGRSLGEGVDEGTELGC